MDLYPGPCSARLLTCTTNLTLAPLSSCCRKGRSFYGSLLSQNCCGEMAGSADLPVAPKLAQFSVDKCGQIWDNANRYTKYIRIQDMRRDMLQYVTYICHMFEIIPSTSKQKSTYINMFHFYFWCSYSARFSLNRKSSPGEPRPVHVIDDVHVAPPGVRAQLFGSQAEWGSFSNLDTIKETVNTWNCENVFSDMKLVSWFLQSNPRIILHSRL